MATVLPNLTGKLWTRAEYETFSAGLADQKFELVEGELISTMGKNRPHVIVLTRLRNWLSRVFGEECVQTEAPIDVAPEDNPTSEPEPDVMVTRQEASHFPSSNPGPADLLLVVEIASTSLVPDLSRKARLYARAGITEYWVLDVSSRRPIVHRDPRGGEYRNVVSYTEKESVTPLAAPQAALRVGSILLP